MAFRVLYPYTTGATLNFGIKRLADGLLYDFGDGTFKATPGTLTAPLPEGTPTWVGLYMVTLDPTPVAEFPDGGYAVPILEGGVTIDILADTMHDGDDVTTKVTLDMAQVVPMVKTQTLGGALNGSLASTFGRSVKDRVNRVLQLFGIGQSVPLVTFDLDDPANPSVRTPRP